MSQQSMFCNHANEMPSGTCDCDAHCWCKIEGGCAEHSHVDGYSAPAKKSASAKMRVYKTGATRSSDVGKNDYEGFLSPRVIEMFGNYMTKHRVQADGQPRAADNWQKGISMQDYMKSFVRHAVDLWYLWRGSVPERMKQEMPHATYVEYYLEALGGIMFNIQGFALELLKARDRGEVPIFSSWEE